MIYVCVFSVVFLFYLADNSTNVACRFAIQPSSAWLFVYCEMPKPKISTCDLPRVLLKCENTKENQLFSMMEV